MPTAKWIHAPADLTLNGAERLLWYALDYAAERGARVSISVVDRVGYLLCAARMTEASGISAQISLEKAKTAAQLKTATNSIQRSVDTRRPSYLSIPNLCPVSGGFPIHVDDLIVGAIGVSGSAELVDQDIAEYAANSFAAEFDTAAMQAQPEAA